MLDEKSKGSIRMYKDRLNILLNIVQTINADFSPEKLVEEIEVILIDQLNLSKVLIFTHYKGAEWSTLLMSGVDPEVRDAINIEEDLLVYSQIETISVDHPPHLGMFDAIIPLFHRFKPIGFVLIGYNDEPEESFSNGHNTIGKEELSYKKRKHDDPSEEEEETSKESIGISPTE